MCNLNIAICCIGYNRVDSMARLLNSLDKAKYTHPVTLIVSIDRSKTTIVKDYADSFDWKHGDKMVILQPENLGLRKHVLTCGGYIEKLNLDALVVLEDDITVSPYFYQYAEECVCKYHDDERIAGISLYTFLLNYQAISPFNPVYSEYDVFMMNCAMSWGQVWMKRQWLAFTKWYETHGEDFSLPHLPAAINSWGKKSWLKYHTRYCIEENKYFVYPYESLSTNNGDAGTHKKGIEENYNHSHLQTLAKESYKLPSVEGCEIKYDGFFNPKFLGRYLGIDDNELLVDFYGNRSYYKGHRYLLSRKGLPYRVMKSFALQYRPFEANIILNVEGNDFYLYDLSQEASAPQSLDEKVFYKYQYFNAFVRAFRVWGVGGILSYIINAGISRLKR